MAIKIDKILIKKLGPINSIQLELGILNVIYGRNETGKTYLTEFILKSIFRHARTWKLRDIDPEGSIQLTGLKDQTITFSPASLRKIEDYWDESDKGLPTNMARLLVVKGGELALSSGDRNDVDRETLKNTLTSQVILDQIRGNIQTTVQKAQIVDRKVTGKNQGQISDLNSLENELRNLENLLELIEENYSRGPARQIEEEIKALQENLDQLLKAQKHQAYLLSKSQNDLLLKREKLSDESYLALRDRVRDYKKLQSNLTKLASKIKSSRTDVDNYHWLDSAMNIWEDKELEKKRTPEIIFLVAGGVLFIAGLIAVALQHNFSWRYLNLAGIITAALGGSALFYFGLRQLISIEFASDTDERRSIQSSFEEKFDRKIKGITDLRAEQNKLKDKFIRSNSYQEDYVILENQLEKDQQWIKETFQEITGNSAPEKSWEKSLETIKNKNTALDAEIADLALQLAKINIPEDEYLSDPQETVFNPESFTNKKHQIASLSDELAAQQKELDTLKVRATEWTRDDISTAWSDVLHNLRQIRIEISQSHKDLTAELVAKIGLSEIIGEIEEEEDQKILENINKPTISDMMEKITGKYKSLNLVNDQVYVSDTYREYPLQDLSTGAREQIQLALRLGIASNISGGEPLFLILDDAFQHSDWERRESLVNETVKLAQAGWQIIYLTMDDHIRDLLRNAGKTHFKSQFSYFHLD